MPHRKIVDEFRFSRDDTNRAKLVAILAEHLGKQLPLREVIDEIYGKRKGSAAALGQVVKGVEGIIAKRKLAYSIMWAKRKQEKTLGLYPVEDEGCTVITQRATLAAINPKGWLAGEDN